MNATQYDDWQIYYNSLDIHHDMDSIAKFWDAKASYFHARLALYGDARWPIGHKLACEP